MQLATHSGRAAKCRIALTSFSQSVVRVNHRFIITALVVIASACSDAVGPDARTGTGVLTPGGRPVDAPTTPALPPASLTNPLAGSALYVQPGSAARKQADLWRASRPADAAQMDKMADQPLAKWIGNWNSDVRGEVDRLVASATAGNAIPVFVAYNIPGRDCGGYSGGNTTTSPDSYRAWIDGFAAGIAGRRAVVVLEPDALAGMDCLSETDRKVRTDLLSYAVQKFRSLGSTSVYLDAGHSHWRSASTMADRLISAGIALANGFSLNISNFYATSEQVSYGSSISALVGGKHYIVDTSRNGLGSAGDGAWCNPAGRALGPKPTTATGNSLVDAYLWLKVPGESDGNCDGSPAAGSWMPEYALGLAQRAAY